MFVSEYFKKRQFLKRRKTNIEENEDLNLELFKEEVVNELGIKLKENEKRED